MNGVDRHRVLELRDCAWCDSYQSVRITTQRHKARRREGLFCSPECARKSRIFISARRIHAMCRASAAKRRATVLLNAQQYLATMPSDQAVLKIRRDAYGQGYAAGYRRGRAHV